MKKLLLIVFLLALAWEAKAQAVVIRRTPAAPPILFTKTPPPGTPTETSTAQPPTADHRFDRFTPVPLTPTIVWPPTEATPTPPAYP